VIGIIGGSGLYNLITIEESKMIDTPFGIPSAEIEIGDFNGKKVAFLPRHGKKHNIPPHMVNYRANIWALHSIGCDEILGINAVGSLKEELKPGDVVIPDQYIDFTKNRKLTFYDGPEVIHISLADPFCPRINKELSSVSKKHGDTHDQGTYVVIEGPRFSTRAESKMFRQFGDIIGMTLVPEINLADELGMCYSLIANVTDYDVWSDKPVEASEVIKILKENEEKTQKIIADFLKIHSEQRTCECKNRLENARL
jgi:5'-methylthioadenosine phosphorylase